MFTRNKYLVRFQPWFDYRQFFYSQHALHKYRQFCLFNLKNWDHRTNISQVQETSSKTSTLAIQVSGSWGLRLNQGNSVKMIWCIENVEYLQCFYSYRWKVWPSVAVAAAGSTTHPLKRDNKPAAHDGEVRQQCHWLDENDTDTRH